ncbi:MAG: single-stranded DNA-binding protein [Candidatus Binataceae bacterium]|nr:single-stranded DNA-binding protein [Candidatus Binataceae bacterium]
MKGNRIEAWGRVIKPAQVRTTPSGTAVLRTILECGKDGDELALGVVMTGEGVQTTAPCITPGNRIRVSGRIRNVARAKAGGGNNGSGRDWIGATGIELVADAVELLDQQASDS